MNMQKHYSFVIYLVLVLTVAFSIAISYTPNGNEVLDSVLSLLNNILGFYIVIHDFSKSDK